MVLRRLAVLSSLVSLFAVVATGTTWALLRAPDERPDPDAPAPAVAGERSPGVRPERPGDRAGPRARASRETRARAVLAAWDARRASAWAAGDPEALRALYAARSSTGRRDLRMLRQWADRGMRVEGMATQVHALAVLASAPGRWRLRVTDRMVGAVAVGGSGSTVLPSDGWTERTIDLRRSPDGWRVVEARRSAGS